jgi:hypothetical protein
MEEGRYDQSPDPDDEDNERFPHGLRKEIRPGNTAKLLTINISCNRAVAWLTACLLACYVL